jgi:beta-lactamase class A
MKKIKKFCSRHKKIIIIVTGSVLALNLVIQVFYPSARLLPGTVLSGQDFSFANKSEAIIGLDQSYNAADINVFFGNNEKPYLTIKPIDVGLSIGNAKRIGDMNYPWFMRILPTSVLWYGAIYSNNSPSLTFSEKGIDQFIDSEFGQDCNIEPANAGLEISGTNLKLIKGSDGGTCKTDDVKISIANLEFVNANYANVRIAMNIIEPDVTDNDARQLASSVGTKLLNNLSLSLGDGYGSVDVSNKELASWLDFEIVNKKLTVVVDSEKSAKFFDETVAPLISQAAGVSIITTSNLSDVIRKNGAEGKMINIKETNQRIAEYLMDQRTSVDVAIQTVQPEIQYSRSFDATSEGITAYIKYFVQTHQGRFGIQLYEVGGAHRQASYYPDREFIVAGASRFIIGYGMLMLQNQGLAMSNNDSDWPCFNSVMWRYETGCVSSAVYTKIRQDQTLLGLNGTSISIDTNSNKSTASDLAEFLMKIYNGQISLSAEYRNNLLNGLKYTEPRDGIASVTSGVMSAGGSNGQQRSDVALVNSGDKTYVLAILTDGSKWSDIANLAKQIDDFMRR